MGGFEMNTPNEAVTLVAGADRDLPKDRHVPAAMQMIAHKS
jgi:hypothetical protein